MSQSKCHGDQASCRADLISRVSAYGDAKIYDRRVTALPELQFELKNRLHDVRCGGIQRIKSHCKDTCRFRVPIEFSLCPEVKTRSFDGEERYSVKAHVGAHVDCPEVVKQECAPKPKKKKCSCKKCRK